MQPSPFFRTLLPALALLIVAPPAPAQTIPRPNPKLIFFPPNPPPLEIPDPNLDLSQIPVSRAPALLRPFVTEPFYAPLSTFASPMITAFQGGETLSESETAALDRFRTTRATLLQALRTKLAQLEFADPATRLRALEAFAREQAPELATLEADAEKLRAALARKADWNELRQWRLRPDYEADPRGARVIELQLIRAAAFYAPGFTPAQRRLLREIAIASDERIQFRQQGRETDPDLLFFQPETARLAWPRRLPPDLERKLRDLTDQKDELKRELAAVVYARDGDFLDATRAAAYRKLADTQTNRLLDIEDLAEELRRAFTVLPAFPRLPRPEPLPTTIRERLEAFQRADRDFAARTGLSLADAAGEGDPLPPRDAPGPRAQWIQQWRTRLHDRGREFTEADVARLHAHIAELDALRDQLERVVGRPLPATEGRTPAGFITQLFEYERRAYAFRDYDLAVLEPGLSPAQRRLLFSGAVEDLRLPLPGAERQATLPPGYSR